MKDQEEFRLIVSGSREYSDALGLRTALNEIFDSLHRDVPGLVVVHGGHPNPDYSTNADRIAQEWAIELEQEGLPVRQEPHPAGWTDPCRPECDHGPRHTWRGESVCPAAGPYRNEEMCAAGAAGGLIALKVGTRSTGTRDCLRRMIRHGIPFKMIIEGNAAGLPEDLISRAGRQQ